MTKDEMRIAIAEACGWKYTRIEADGESLGWVSPEGGCLQDAPDCFPNYPEDLNAMREAESTLSHDQWRIFLGFLIGKKVIPKLASMEDFHRAWNVTAAQRAEAMCRTLWPERWKK